MFSFSHPASKTFWNPSSNHTPVYLPALEAHFQLFITQLYLTVGSTHCFYLILSLELGKIIYKTCHATNFCVRKFDYWCFYIQEVSKIKLYTSQQTLTHWSNVCRGTKDAPVEEKAIHNTSEQLKWNQLGWHKWWLLGWHNRCNFCCRFFNRLVDLVPQSTIWQPLTNLESTWFFPQKINVRYHNLSWHFYNDI